MQQRSDAPAEGRSLSDTHMMLYRAFHARRQTSCDRGWPRSAWGPASPRSWATLG
jgi:hypothetical protein